ncbi:MAG: hypothetical protein N4A74_08445 [Carboxylicivirga sp.]|jgi:hypothetical protein|nr:hypothetical protein [Carboxylicivirga sp.]
MYLRYLSIVFIFISVSCTPDELPQKELWEFIKDSNNNLSFSQNRKGVDIDLYHKPSSFFVQLELTDSSTNQELKAITDRYNEYWYFILGYSYQGKELLASTAGNRGQFKHLVETLSFGMTEKVQVITDQKKKVPLADFSHVRQYGMGRKSNVLLVFNKNEILDQTKEYFTIKIKDIGVNIGTTVFSFQKTDILNCPKLKLKKDE